MRQAYNYKRMQFPTMKLTRMGEYSVQASGFTHYDVLDYLSVLILFDQDDKIGEGIGSNSRDSCRMSWDLGLYAASVKLYAEKCNTGRLGLPLGTQLV